MLYKIAADSATVGTGLRKRSSRQSRLGRQSVLHVTMSNPFNVIAIQVHYPGNTTGIVFLPWSIVDPVSTPLIKLV